LRSSLTLSGSPRTVRPHWQGAHLRRRLLCSGRRFAGVRLAAIEGALCHAPVLCHVPVLWHVQVLCHVQVLWPTCPHVSAKAGITLAMVMISWAARVWGGKLPCSRTRAQLVTTCTEDMVTTLVVWQRRARCGRAHIPDRNRRFRHQHFPLIPRGCRVRLQWCACARTRDAMGNLGHRRSRGRVHVFRL